MTESRQKTQGRKNNKFAAASGTQQIASANTNRYYQLVNDSMTFPLAILHVIQISSIDSLLLPSYFVSLSSTLRRAI